jgi:hypothetical protein
VLYGLKRDLIVLALVKIVGAVVDAHVAQEAGWQEKSRVLHGTALALPCEGKLGWIGQ